MAQVVPLNDDDGAPRGADDGGRVLPSFASSPGRSRRRANRGSVATIGFETPREHTVVIGSAWQLAEKLYDRPATQAVIYLALALALFGLDLYDLGGVGDEHLAGMWAALTAVLLVFGAELAVCTRCKQGYWLGFFFWADLVGALSLIFDIPWLNPLSTGDADEPTVLASSRADRHSMRAARLMRLQRLVKVLRVIRAIKLVKGARVAQRMLGGGEFGTAGTAEEQAEEAARAAARGAAAQQSHESASAVTNHLSDLLAKRTALLVMFMVITFPFLLSAPEDTYQTRAYALQSMAVLPATTGATGAPPSQAALDEMFSFFAGSAESPLRLELARASGGGGGVMTNKVYQPGLDGATGAVVARCCAGCGMGDLNGSALRPGGACAVRARTSRARHNITYLYRHDDGAAESRLECDQEAGVVHGATLSVLLVLYVVVLLVGSSRVLSSTVRRLVAEPLARIFDVAQQAMEGVAGALEGLSQIKQFAECDDQVESLEAAVRRLGRIVRTSTRKGGVGGGGGGGGGAGAAQVHIDAAEAGEENMEWLREDYEAGGASGEGKRTLTASAALDRSVKLRKLTRQAGGLRVQAAQQQQQQGQGGAQGDTQGGRVSREALAALGGAGWSYCSLDYVGAAESGAMAGLLLPSGELAVAAHVHALFERVGAWRHFRVSDGAARAFAHGVLRSYPADNPYHNAYHAVDTLFMFVRLLDAIDGTQLLSRLDIFAGLVAALGHDMNHPGVTNAFLATTRDALAITYNDAAVLENMHCASLYQLLGRSEGSAEGSILAGLSKEQWSAMRKTVVHAILATDMAQHFKMVADLEGFYEENAAQLAPDVLYNKAKAKGATCTSAEDHMDDDNTNVFGTEQRGRMLVETLLHAADISNVAKPLRTCELWTPRVMAEFFAQGDREKALGAVPIAMHDRERASAAQSQVGFIDFVVGPLYANVIKIFPGLANPVAANLIDVRAAAAAAAAAAAFAAFAFAVAAAAAAAAVAAAAVAAALRASALLPPVRDWLCRD